MKKETGGISYETDHRKQIVGKSLKGKEGVEVLFGYPEPPRSTSVMNYINRIISILSFPVMNRLWSMKQMPTQGPQERSGYVLLPAAQVRPM